MYSQLRTSIYSLLASVSPDLYTWSSSLTTGLTWGNAHPPQTENTINQSIINNKQINEHTDRYGQTH